ncbi:MAG: tRNA (cytosine(32)/uridine(32)-2'-O)-methyltransferase TrmJ [Gammaproteobacteria bacterium]|uniref:tRNA (cytidine/uridine-2'-O-)-methyltransferase TrmJ n=1 Tax=OM182 bacterium MED-G24 TaxID=1986255 RepID=A0A2A5WYN2_9GAMM|nr:tRNA (cytosine(32)/uridine(32)-2'-O)-methyltransferase TrmJ [Gammaproteobacteria bacterium]PDH41655.1 MAG: tRNA (cytosine(32)/uridine(32)-2'-O)-methyltransferase TrmJ [OM182 bacterium MED-G24]RPG26678.1 MAG: RNA methyltransferase [Gammaproteobacteria bacterium TMED50]|tara:strand:- start:13252 stop:14004 length:753 start_codon:yes stop_codon:yes gene_type:complete
MSEETAASVNLFPGIRIVLVETSHPGNIGAAARAMKNMGLLRLYLVSPADFPNEQAVFRAVSAADVVDNAIVVSSVDEAISGCHLVIGTSARERRIPWPLLTAKTCAEKVVSECRDDSDIAILFGRESRGLTNEELHRCQYHVNIPTGAAYSSLNLAMAVQVICYEILQAAEGEPPKLDWDMPPATADAVEHLLTHLEETLVDVGFHDRENPRQLMTRVRRLFTRVRLDEMEVNILRGFLTAVNQRTRSD